MSEEHSRLRDQEECRAAGGKELFKDQEEGHCGDNRAREGKKDRKGKREKWRSKKKSGHIECCVLCPGAPCRCAYRRQYSLGLILDFILWVIRGH